MVEERQTKRASGLQAEEVLVTLRHCWVKAMSLSSLHILGWHGIYVESPAGRKRAKL